MEHEQIFRHFAYSEFLPSAKIRNFMAVAVIIGSMLSFMSCDDDIECDRADSVTTNESRNISGYTGVVFNTIGDIYITQGPGFTFQIQGPENVVAATSSTVEDGLLVIGTTKCFNGNASIRVDITAPDLSRIGMSGTGKIFIEDTLSADKLTLELYGIGEIHAALDVDSLFTDVVGNGIAEYTGSAYSHVMRCSGDIVLNSYDLITTNTNILITGLGTAYVSVANKLGVVISGQGNVYYKGNPVIDSNITGTGNVIDAN